MVTLHIAPGYSAGGSLSQAHKDTRPHDEVLRWPDDLSCGPIATDDPLTRAEWWGYTNEDWKLEFILLEFWQRVADSKDDLVVWFARGSSMELAFFLNWIDRLGDRSYKIIDATGKQFLTTKRNGTVALIDPTAAVSLLGPNSLAALLGTERDLTVEEKAEARERWSN